MKIYLSAPQNTPYQSSFVLDSETLLKNSGFFVFRSSDKYNDNQTAFDQIIDGDEKLLVSDENRSGRLAKSVFAQQVFQENFNNLAESKALVALLDGSQVDDRVACEIGLFYGLMISNKTKKGIFGLATDARCLRRRDTTYGINIFTLGTLEEVGKVYEDITEIIRVIKKSIL